MIRGPFAYIWSDAGAIWSPLATVERERRADSIGQLKRQQLVVPVEAWPASERSARQQPVFNLSSSCHSMRNSVGSARLLRSCYATTEAYQSFSSRHLTCVQCHKMNAPNPSDRWRYKRTVLSLCMWTSSCLSTLQTRACCRKCAAAPPGFTIFSGSQNSLLHPLAWPRLASRIDYYCNCICNLFK